MKETKENDGNQRILARVLAVLLSAMALVFAGMTACAQETKAEDMNILLVGTDHRDDSWNGNSDTMILATVKPDSERIILASFMRDLYADIPGYGVHKLNYAFAAAGAEKLIETLENNYELSIDHYVVVDFDSMAEIVDIVGGVDMTISDDECKWLNGYLNSMEAWDDYLPGGGTYTLNGNQAVAYARIRYVGNNDYQRTQRQRDILKEIFEKVRGLGAEQIASLAKNVIPEVEHDYNALEMLELMAQLPTIAGYDLEEQRIPYDDLYYSQNEMLVPDFEATRERLHEALGD
ncbi:MAG: LCP family protein [Lachnospiraceae bacterium]|nr:LCP family protein [Lachnospiraceae bacterium]